MLLIESEHDDIVPQTVLSSYREACTHARSLTYRCIPAADHGLTGDSDQRAYTTLLVNWLTEMLFGARAGKLSTPAPSADTATLPETPPKTI